MSTTDYLKKHNLHRISIDIDKKVFLKLKKMMNDEGKYLRRGIKDAIEEYVERHTKLSK